VSRLFYAVGLPEPVLDVVAALPRPDEKGVRYTTREQWHVTLRFLGEADETEAQAALERVNAAPCRATLGPQVSRLGRNVVVAPVAGLESVAAAVAAETADLGTPPDARPFAGHVTVARLRRRGSCRIAGALISAEFGVEEVVLMRSRLHPDGARYDTVARRVLG